MKSFAIILALFAANRLLLWLFPQSDTLFNYSLLPIGILAVILIVASELKSTRVPVE